MKKTHSKILYLPVASLIFAFTAVTASAETVVYSESFAPAPSTVSNFNIQLGGDPALVGTNFRLVDKGVWGLTAFGSIVDVGGDNGNVLRPQEAGRQNSRVAGVFLDSDHFAATGPGTYTLSFDVIPTSNEAGAGRVYVGAGSGYDLSGETDAKLTLSLAANGFGVHRPSGDILWAALTGSNGATATHLITTPTEWIDSDSNETGEFRDAPGAPLDVLEAATWEVDFEYDGTSTLVIAFGGYNTDFKVDNIAIFPATETVDPGNGNGNGDENGNGDGNGFWAGYPIDAYGFVDTGDFLGMIWVTDLGDFVWSAKLGQFIYLPEEFVRESGAWVYIPRIGH